ncbi:hypothetical protein LC55x_3608 [Lysobacter capsici]|nr:hypothetical protein LC55x_3608 [Lysobacter capsici]
MGIVRVGHDNPGINPLESGRLGERRATAIAGCWAQMAVRLPHADRCADLCAPAQCAAMAVAAARRDAACGGEMNRRSLVPSVCERPPCRVRSGPPVRRQVRRRGREPTRNVVETRRIASVRSPTEGENRRAVPTVAAVAILPNRSLRKGMP